MPTPWPCSPSKKKWEQPRKSWELLVHAVTRRVMGWCRSVPLCRQWVWVLPPIQRLWPKWTAMWLHTGRSLVVIYTQTLFPVLSFLHTGAAIAFCSGQSLCHRWGRAGFEGAGSSGAALCASPLLGSTAWHSAHHRKRVAAVQDLKGKHGLGEVPSQRKVPHPFWVLRLPSKILPGAVILGAPLSLAMGGKSFTYRNEMGGASGNFIK